MVFKEGVGTAKRRSLTVGVIFSALLVPGLLTACDGAASGGQDGATQLDRGKSVYSRYCAVCHPGGGAGSGPSLIALGPRLSDDQIKYAVRNGKNRMPGYKEKDISESDLDGLVAYVRSLK